jgi:hypothetical protein
VQGMMNAMAVFKEEIVKNNRVIERTDLQLGFEELNELMGMKTLDEIERKFVGG